MANPNAPFGLIPTGKNYPMSPYGIVPGVTLLYLGDPVKKDTAGTADGLSTCTIATTGATLGAIGAILDSTGAPVSRYPGGSVAGYVAMVYDHPDQEFIAQEDSDTSTIVQANLGLNADLVTGTGNATTGRSGWTIDSSSVAVTATLMVRILRLAQIPGNEIGDYAKYVVKINNHANGNHTGTVGV